MSTRSDIINSHPRVSKRSSIQRILAFDLLRGYFLIVILIDHLARYPGIFEYITGKGYLWASAAEGFFVVSGIMVGLIRGNEAKRGQLKRSNYKLLKRALNIYLLSVSLTVLATLIAWWCHDVSVKSGAIEPGRWFDLITQSISLRYTYGWADFLPYYAAFMVVAPLALWLAYKSKTWLVVVISILVWYFGRSHSQYFAWQLLFFGGLAVGYHLNTLQARWASLMDAQKNAIVTILVVVSTITVVASVLVIFGQGLNPIVENFGKATLNWFDKTSAAPGRVVVSAIWLSTLFILVRKYEGVIAHYIGWLLLPLGRNSLFTYGSESVVLLLVSAVFPYAVGLVLNICISLLTIITVWMLTTLYTELSQHQKVFQLYQLRSKAKNWLLGTSP